MFLEIRLTEGLPGKRARDLNKYFTKCLISRQRNANGDTALTSRMTETSRLVTPRAGKGRGPQGHSHFGKPFRRIS